MKILLTALLLCALCSAYAQHENDLWFQGGGKSGVRFDHGLKQFKPYSVHEPLGGEGCGVATDPASGDLLFYTDGNTIYHNGHGVMPGGSNLGGDASSAQAVAIVPVPGGCGTYYVFSNSKGGTPAKGELFYSLVDMNQNGGLGEVTFIKQKLRDNVLEGMIAIQKPNSRDFWLVGSDGNPGATFYAFEISTAGISPIPVTSDVGPGDYRYCLSYSEKAKKIAACYPSGFVRTFDFNTVSGQLSKEEVVEANFPSAYGCEWSPDGTKLYYSNWNNGPGIRQYDFLNKQMTPILSNALGKEGGGLKLGPDNKIYFISDQASPYLSCIKDPDQAGAACGFQANCVSTGDDIRGLNLPVTLIPAWSPPGCSRPAWQAFINSINNYREPNEVLCQVIKGGQAYIEPALSANPYYWSQFVATLPQPARISDQFSIECRVRNRKTSGGISAFDIGVWLSDGNKSARMYFMGDPAAVAYANIGFGEQVKDSLPELITDFEQWQTLRLEVQPGILQAYLNNVLRYSFTYKGSLCKLSQFGVSFKGSGELDWVKLRDQGALIYQENFDAPTEFACLQTTLAEDYYINHYAAVQMICGNRLTVSNPAAFQPGDQVLLIQMAGAAAEVSETSDCGKVVSYGKAGNYEMNIVDKVVGNSIYLKNRLLREYDVTGKVQLVFVPDVGDATLGCISCPAWDGSTGGVLAFTGGDIILQGDLDVSGKGFQGGVFYDEFSVHFNTTSFNFEGNSTNNPAAFKGQGIAAWLDLAARGKGNRANAGGGGNEHNNGGGGGGNGGSGGLGGIYEGNTYTGGGGMGGRALQYDQMTNRIFMGGGGGAGHSNNGRGSRGGNGGGIIIASVHSIQSDGSPLRANGEDAPTYETWRQIPLGTGDGGGGGGGGGTILLDITGPVSANLLLEAKGGQGSSVEHRHGHGGGGGGGVVWVSAWPGGNAALSSGDPGIGTDGQHNGATAGTNGRLLTGLSIPRSYKSYDYLDFDSIQFTPDCQGTAQLKLLATGGETPWEYSITGGSSWGSAPVFGPLAAGKYSLAVRDACHETKEQIVEAETYLPLQAVLAYVRDRRCDSLSIIALEAKGGKEPLQFQLDGVWQNSPWFTDLAGGTTYTVRVRDGLGCTRTIEVPVADLSEQVQVTARPDTTVVHGAMVQMSGNASTTYPGAYTFQWSPAYGLSDPHIVQTKCSPEITTTYTLLATDPYGCTGEASTLIAVKDLWVYVPNAFCPECAGFNNYFTAMSADGVRLIKWLRVFDRWGNQVFEATNFQPGDEQSAWRGDFRGHSQPRGVYVWQLELEVIDGRLEYYQGDVTLLR